ncbi:hypothetical protein [Eremococcus coleocola]|uniref:hypothetical protein n=1 Tax=Eremococcus coleocola TaxID=88132 RepID=UPI00040A1331|nr:hypothetical protein [Eremococcus coleocola]
MLSYLPSDKATLIPFVSISKEILSQMNTLSVADFSQEKIPYQLLDVRHPKEITRIVPQKNLINLPF